MKKYLDNPGKIAIFVVRKGNDMKTYKIMMRRKNLKTGKITSVKEYDRGYRDLEGAQRVCKMKFLEAKDVTDGVVMYDVNCKFEGEWACIAYMRGWRTAWIYNVEEC